MSATATHTRGKVYGRTCGCQGFFASRPHGENGRRVTLGFRAPEAWQQTWPVFLDALTNAAQATPNNIASFPRSAHPTGRGRRQRCGYSVEDAMLAAAPGRLVPAETNQPVAEKSISPNRGASPDQLPSTTAVVAVDDKLLGCGCLRTLGSQHANTSGASKNKLPMISQILFAATGETEAGNVSQSAKHSILLGKTRRHKDIPFACQRN
jgi:hypothetical protein